MQTTLLHVQVFRAMNEIAFRPGVEAYLAVIYFRRHEEVDCAYLYYRGMEKKYQLINTVTNTGCNIQIDTNMCICLLAYKQKIKIMFNNLKLNLKIFK